MGTVKLGEEIERKPRRLKEKRKRKRKYGPSNSLSMTESKSISGEESAIGSFRWNCVGIEEESKRGSEWSSG